MSPRRTDQATTRTTATRRRPGPSQDRRRDIDDKRHHPATHELPHPPHKPQKKPKLPPRHTPHTRPPADELGPHVNKPGPIKPSKKMTKKGTQK